MSTYKRPMKEGEVCEDQRVEFSPKLGQAEEKQHEVQVAKAKKATKTEVKEDETVEATTEATVKSIEE